MMITGIDQGNMDAQTLLAQYCTLLHQRFGTYEEVARRTGLDRRTVRKYVHLDADDPTD
jgi:DNA-binding transcriptional regulator LsrR (DeoR family)